MLMPDRDRQAGAQSDLPRDVAALCALLKR
jgi:hypothetical protein